MNSSSQRAYLEVLGIPVWIRKELADQESTGTPAGLKLGPGSSQTLLVCASADEAARRIAADIARCLKSEPVWAWTEPDLAEPAIGDVVSEHLFTTVLVFGEDLAVTLFGSKSPETLGSARIITTESLAILENSPVAKRSLWNQITANHLAVRRGK